MFMFEFRFGLHWYGLVLVRLAYTANFRGLGFIESTFPGGWLDGVVGHGKEFPNGLHNLT